MNSLNTTKFEGKKTVEVKIGNIVMGGGNDIIVQSMTNTRTSDLDRTFTQCCQLFDAGAELIRLSVVDTDDMRAVPFIKEKLNQSYRNVPIALCMHFNGHILLEQSLSALEYAQKIRVNPGNVGFGKAKDKNLESIVNSLKKAEDISGEKKALRIGANYGSIDPLIWQKISSFAKKYNKDFSKDEIDIASLIISILLSKSFLNSIDLPDEQIVISCKLSDAKMNFIANLALAQIVENPLHIGVTECGIGQSGIINASSGMSPLLMLGIGDTIRCSITSFSELNRSIEVDVCYNILNSIGIRKSHVKIISCPGCGRTKVDFFAKTARELEIFIKEKIEPKLRDLSLYIKIAIMGCVVNGPGESKSSDIGISLIGRNEDKSVIYVCGEKFSVVESQQELFDKFNQAIDYLLDKLNNDKAQDNNKYESV